ncbi:sugar phosphate isomerase/epimerase family protein [Occultella gossypii]|uniref:Sugar phosphate isomerase/epimerase n=1 Tax=Occultella gossypii TaxID=2800820 RepID=A0ABS7SI55_9MICO|nr:sugar phosphate isomerase/epimerase family protein [Occultella gossypii]MBZ2198953.1 sugar phosphate isomerase/epimerase [Occultella gossypii]
MTAPFTADTWPIGVGLPQLVGTLTDGRDVTTTGPQAWRPTFHEVAAAGFTEIDLFTTFIRISDLDADARSSLQRLLAEYGLRISAIPLARRSILDPDPDRATANLEFALETVRAAGELGVGTVCVGLHQPLTAEQQQAEWFWLAPGEENPEDPAVWAAAVEGFRRIGEEAARAQVQVSLEMYEGTYLGTSESSVRLVTDIGLPNVGLCPDIGNIVRLHRPVEDWRVMLERMLPHANYWQLKNYLRDHDPATGAYFSAPAPLETGYIDYRTAVGMALAAGFSGPLCVEHYGGDGLSVAATNRDYLRRILAAKIAS